MDSLDLVSLMYQEGGEGGHKSPRDGGGRVVTVTLISMVCVAFKGHKLIKHICRTKPLYVYF